jgi:hypothetical protein
MGLRVLPVYQGVFEDLLTYNVRLNSLFVRKKDAILYIPQFTETGKRVYRH